MANKQIYDLDEVASIADASLFMVRDDDEADPSKEIKKSLASTIRGDLLNHERRWTRYPGVFTAQWGKVRFNASDTSRLPVGTPLRINDGGTNRYLMVTAVGSGYVDTTGNVQYNLDVPLEVYYGLPEMVVVFRYVISGVMSASADLLASRNKQYSAWNGPAAHLVGVDTVCATSTWIGGGTTHSAFVTVKINGVLSAAVAGPLGGSAVWSCTGADVSIALDNTIELYLALTGLSITDLTVQLVFVLE
jgi:hypothetical protein